MNKLMNWLRACMFDSFKGLTLFQKIVGLLLYFPVIVPISFYQVFIQKKGLSGGKE